MGVCDVPVISTVCDVAGEAAATVVAAPFDWLAQAMGGAAGWLIEAMWAVFDTTTLVDVQTDGFTSVYNLIFGIAVFVMLLFFYLIGLGLVFGALAIRRQGIYFAMITLALSQMFFFACLQMPFTHGEDGIQSVPKGVLFGVIELNRGLNMYWFVAVVFALALWAIWRIVHSPFGMILKAIRENEQRAISLGYSVARYKLGAFVMSAAFAGLAGGMKALVMEFATLTDVAWQMSGEVILMTLIGGIGTMLGPILGSSIVIALQQRLATSDFPVTIITGLVFMVCVLLFRRGLIGELAHSRIGRAMGLRPPG